MTEGYRKGRCDSPDCDFEKTYLRESVEETDDNCPRDSCSGTINIIG